MSINKLTQNEVRSLFDYREGKLYWKVSRSACVKVGSRAGYQHKENGYWIIGITVLIFLPMSKQ